MSKDVRVSKEHKREPACWNVYLHSSYTSRWSNFVDTINRFLCHRMKGLDWLEEGVPVQLVGQLDHLCRRGVSGESQYKG